MNKIISSIALVLFLTAGQVAFGQNNKDLALAKGQEAISLMDKGKIEESIKLLKEAQKLDPDRLDYPYELAYAYHLKKDYKTAIEVLEKNVDHKDVSERFFQLLGNSYDINGEPAKALETYDAGLKKFPNSGMMFLEKGNVHWVKKEYDKALSFYEKGIEVAPHFPSNYYRAALIYLNSTEEVWGMLYGEIFMNLERNSKRTAEMSKLLYDTYNSQIKFTGKGNLTVSFCQQMTMSASALSDPTKSKLPFCMVYEPTLMLAAINENKIDLDALDNIRTGFVETYFKKDFHKTHPNLLFSYQDKIL